MRILGIWMMLVVVAVVGVFSAQAQQTHSFDAKLSQQVQAVQQDNFAQASAAERHINLDGGTLKGRVVVRNATGDREVRAATGVAVGVHHFMVYTHMEPGDTVSAVDIKMDNGKWLRLKNTDKWLYNYGLVWDTKTDSEQFCRNYEYKYCTDLVVWGRMPETYRFRIFYHPLMVAYTSQNATKLEALLQQKHRVLTCSPGGVCKIVTAPSENIDVYEDENHRFLFQLENDNLGEYPSYGTSLRVDNVFLGFGRFSGTYMGLGNGYHPEVTGVKTITNIDELL